MINCQNSTGSIYAYYCTHSLIGQFPSVGIGMDPIVCSCMATRDRAMQSSGVLRLVQCVEYNNIIEILGIMDSAVLCHCIVWYCAIHSTAHCCIALPHSTALHCRW